MPFREPKVAVVPKLTRQERMRLRDHVRPLLKNETRSKIAIKELKEAIQEARLGLAMGFNQRPQERKITLRELEALREGAQKFQHALVSLSDESRWRLSFGPVVDSENAAKAHRLLRSVLDANFDWDAQEKARYMCFRTLMAIEWAHEAVQGEERPGGRPHDRIAWQLGRKCERTWRTHIRGSMGRVDRGKSGPWGLLLQFVFEIAGLDGKKADSIAYEISTSPAPETPENGWSEGLTADDIERGDRSFRAYCEAIVSEQREGEERATTSEAAFAALHATRKARPSDRRRKKVSGRSTSKAAAKKASRSSTRQQDNAKPTSTSSTAKKAKSKKTAQRPERQTHHSGGKTPRKTPPK